MGVRPRAPAMPGAIFPAMPGRAVLGLLCLVFVTWYVPMADENKKVTCYTGLGSGFLTTLMV